LLAVNASSVSVVGRGSVSVVVWGRMLMGYVSSGCGREPMRSAGAVLLYAYSERGHCTTLCVPIPNKSS
jgi:hypothetical protein